jgi:vacuole morphology and inheritance protein 14
MAGALLGLCFLAQAYSHACDLIECFTTLPVGAEVLVQVDRLVQLLETPNFTYLRLQLLQPAK